MENSIEEALEKLSTGKKIKMYELLRTFKKEGIENFVITRKKYVDVILSDYKRVLKENKQPSTEMNSLKKENEELRAKWDKDTHILQNELDYANADRIDLVQQNKELRKENEEKRMKKRQQYY